MDPIGDSILELNGLCDALNIFANQMYVFLCILLLQRISEPQNAKNPINTRRNLRTQKQNLVTKFLVKNSKMLIPVRIR